MTRLNAILVVVAMSMQLTHAQQRVSPDPGTTSLDDLILFDSRIPEGSENCLSGTMRFWFGEN